MTQHLSSLSHVATLPIPIITNLVHTLIQHPPPLSFTSTSTTIPQQPIQLIAAPLPSPYPPYSPFLQLNYAFSPHQPPQIQFNHQIPYQNLPQIPPLPIFISPKLELTVFDGTNLLEWLFQPDQYFSFYNLPPENRLSMMSFYMKSDD